MKESISKLARNAIVLTGCLLGVFMTDAQAQNKRVLLEQMTSTWFRYATLANWFSESVADSYPDDVILVNLHYDKNTLFNTFPWEDERIESMGIKETKILSDFTVHIGGSYFWSFLNRKKLRKDTSTGEYTYTRPPELEEYAPTAIQEPPKASVQMEWTIDPDTRQLIARLFVIMLETVEKPLRFNLYVVEDSVTEIGRAHV